MNCSLSKYSIIIILLLASAQKVSHFSFSIRVGLDLVEGVVRDNKKAGVFEPGICKIKCLKFATEAAITILRIDDMIKLAPDEQESMGRH